MPESTSSSPPEHLWAVVLAGGVGSRFWPVSTPTLPKQLLALAGDEPLIAQTLRRIQPIVRSGRTLVLTGAHLVAPIRAAVAGLERDAFLLEPRARGTAPVLVWAAHEIAKRDPDAVMASVHADHVIQPEESFRRQIVDAAALASATGRLVTIGIEPTRPETGYGYIDVGEELRDSGIRNPETGNRKPESAFGVREFVEKPDRATAERYLASGYLWNSGLFVWRATALLDEVRAHTPELASLLPLLDAGDVAGFFDAAPILSIDEGVLERSERVAVVRATFRWDDVGAWDAVARTLPADGRGNVAHGAAYAIDSDGCIAWSDDAPIVLFGARDLVVVRTRELTLIMPRERAADLKQLLESLPAELKELE
ncbi:MAG TPA: sugar phosphate nucleotidyltransferase [Longimicrobiales bacterium]|nr:sugar phosphate nucleotidyltransferase [Longimicrobiales bacterium]